MKYILLLVLVTSSSFAVCLKLDVGIKFRCKPIIDSQAYKWCDKKFGQGYLPYKTTKKCSKEVQYQFLNYKPQAQIEVEPVKKEPDFFVEAYWTKNYSKEVVVRCSDDKNLLCDVLCEDENLCILEEGMAKNFVGTSISLMNFLNNVGKSILSSGRANEGDVVRLLQSGNFVTLTSQTVYNLITKVNSKKLQRQFRSLCDDGTQYPLVLAEVFEKTRDVVGYSYVVCKSGVYELEDQYMINLKKSYLH
ncbi:MAG: hypothetical protein N4A33_10325 [Bacteriovoracaceae bacterium]|jgi:hypothetical protein|nr:hypothetical protein [Bacteriovoracaceae bacterium]